MTSHHPDDRSTVHGARSVENHVETVRTDREHTDLHHRGHDHAPSVAVTRSEGRLPAGRVSRVSWGAILAGVVTFLALTVVLSLVAAALGLSGAGGAAAGIWTLISLAIALAAAGYVAGALAVRSGHLHGMLTWATSLVGLLLAVGLLGSSLLGTIGNAVGGAAGNDQIVNQVEQTVTEVQQETSQEEIDQAQQDAAQTADQAADDVSTGLWWTVGGLLLGGAIATLLGGLGAKAAQRKHAEETGYDDDIVIADRH